MEILELSLMDYYKYRISEHGMRYLLEFTDSHYPRFLSTGFYTPKGLIVVAKVGNWKLRIEHEKGHAKGLKHTSILKIGYVMHPWGILRGYNCV
jgi:hypothetical protein